jgi:2-polyprenyl-6-methoxyphenol hydroxylase-like FAD-dependent oxidoreductase
MCSPARSSSWHALGLLPQLDALGVRTAEVCYFNRHGQRIWSEPRGLAAGYRVPQFSIHRGELQMLLMQTALERLGPQAVHCGQEAVAVDPDSASVTLLDRDSGRTRVERADAVISADGIHSAVRRQFYPNEGPPRYSGRVLWRATTVGKPFLTGASMVMAGHADQKLVTYPISRRHADQGESLINWIAELKVPGDTPPKSDWNKEVALDVFAGPFEAWRWDWLDVPALFRGASTSTSSRWSTATRCRAGPTAESRCSAMPVTRCTRSAPTVPPRPSSTRARWSTSSPAPMWRACRRRWSAIRTTGCPRRRAS